MKLIPLVVLTSWNSDVSNEKRNEYTWGNVFILIIYCTHCTDTSHFGNKIPAAAEKQS